MSFEFPWIWSFLGEGDYGWVEWGVFYLHLFESLVLNGIGFSFLRFAFAVHVE